MDLAFFAYLGSPFSTTKFFVDLQPNIDLAFFAYLARPFSTTKFSIDSQPNIDLAFFAYLARPFSTTKFSVDSQPNLDLAFFAYLARSFSTTSDGSNTILSNIKWTRTSFLEHRTNTNVVIYLWLNSNTWILASNKRTSNIKPKNPSLDLLIHWTDSSIIFQTPNELEVFIFW